VTVIALICRHGETELNAEDIMRGWIDAPLDAHGMKEAGKIAKVLKRYPIRQIWSSPLQRAVNTANVFAEQANLDISQDRGLLPWQVGVFAGLNKESNMDALQLFVDDPDVAIPSGESMGDFEERVHDFFDALVASKNGMAAVFTHSTVMTILENLIDGERKRRPYLHQSVEPGGVLELRVSGSRKELVPVMGAVSKQPSMAG